MMLWRKSFLQSYIVVFRLDEKEKLSMSSLLQQEQTDKIRMRLRDLGGFLFLNLLQFTC